MADDALKKRIHDVLKQGYFRDEGDLVDVSDGHDDNVHVVVVSRKFQGKRLKEKQDLIWSELIANLKEEEWGRVTLSVGVSPEELKSV
jgi:acid stress-induced BolA-like protein IbaG/YrbA